MANDATKELKMKLSVEDAASKAFQDVGDNAKEAFDDVEDGAKKTSQALNTASTDTGGFSSAIGVVRAAMGAFAVKEIAQTIIKLGELGAEAQRTERAFINISGGATLAAGHLDAMMTATNGAISRTEAMAQASRLLQMGLVDSSESLGGFTEMAVRLGTAMGRGTNQSIEEFSLLMSNQSIQRLDTFGISAGKVRERITELQGAFGMEREQAFMQAVTEIGGAAMERLGPALEDNMSKIEQNRAAWADLKTEIGIGFAGAVGGANTVIGKFTRQWGDNLRIMHENSDEIGTLRGNLGMLGDALGFNNTVFDKSREAQEEATKAAEFGAVMAGGYAEKLRLVQEAGDGAAGAVYDSADAFAAYSDAVTMFDQGNLDAMVKRTWEMGEAAGAAAIANMNFAASIGEMGKAAFAQASIDIMAESMREAGLGAEEIAEGTRSILVEFGLLTPAEEEASKAIGSLTQKMIDDSDNMDIYAAALLNIHDYMASLESKEIDLTVNTHFNTYGDPASAGGGGGTYIDPGTGSSFGGAVDSPDRPEQITPPVAIMNAAGGYYITTSPTLFMSSENWQPERATFTPLNSPAAAGGGGGTWIGDMYIQGAANPQAAADAVEQRLIDRGILSQVGLR